MVSRYRVHTTCMPCSTARRQLKGRGGSLILLHNVHKEGQQQQSYKQAGYTRASYSHRRTSGPPRMMNHSIASFSTRKWAPAAGGHHKWDKNKDEAGCRQAGISGRPQTAVSLAGAGRQACLQRYSALPPSAHYPYPQTPSIAPLKVRRPSRVMYDTTRSARYSRLGLKCSVLAIWLTTGRYLQAHGRIGRAHQCRFTVNSGHSHKQTWTCKDVKGRNNRKSPTKDRCQSRQIPCSQIPHCTRTLPF